MFSDNEIGILYENGSSKLYEKISLRELELIKYNEFNISLI